MSQDILVVVAKLLFYNLHKIRGEFFDEIYKAFLKI